MSVVYRGLASKSWIQSESWTPSLSSSPSAISTLLFPPYYYSYFKCSVTYVWPSELPCNLYKEIISLQLLLQHNFVLLFLFNILKKYLNFNFIKYYFTNYSCSKYILVHNIFVFKIYFFTIYSFSKYWTKMLICSFNILKRRKKYMNRNFTLYIFHIEFWPTDSSSPKEQCSLYCEVHEKYTL